MSSSASGSGNFVTQQQQGQWLASKLIGTQVVSANNETIGDVNDVVLDRSGTAQAVVVGVGGFLGIGEKDVAVPFKELKVTRQNDGDIDKVTANFNKDQLKQAPEFKTVEDQRSNDNRSTTGSTNNQGNRPANKQ